MMIQSLLNTSKPGHGCEKIDGSYQKISGRLPLRYRLAKREQAGTGTSIYAVLFRF
jgi:hypothetical protein